MGLVVKGYSGYVGVYRGLRVTDKGFFVAIYFQYYEEDYRRRSLANAKVFC